jgi:hypothetical protein
VLLGSAPGEEDVGREGGEGRPGVEGLDGLEVEVEGGGEGGMAATIWSRRAVAGGDRGARRRGSGKAAGEDSQLLDCQRHGPAAARETPG